MAAPPPGNSSDAPGPGTIATRQGHVQGTAYEGGFEFLGIPFASPPVGELRWKPPVDPQPRNAVLPAQAYRPACPQKRFEPGTGTATLDGDEDCLYLNVWTPATRAARLPVMVFIHGGGHQQGSPGQVSAGTQIYNGRNAAARGPAVIVTIAYRLGPLGFLVHPGLEAENASGTAGNYGVMDQIKALQWVRDNIAAFGGDAKRVMVFGESAGGVSVGNLMVTPMARGLFQRAGIHSAVPLLGPYEAARAEGVAFVDGFSSAGSAAQQVADLRSMDWRPLVATETDPVDGGVVQLAWRPVLDRFLFKTDPETAFLAGQYNQVPLLIGSNADESSLSAPPVVTPPMVKALLAAAVPAPYRPHAQRLYPPGSNAAEARQSFVQILTDSQFTSSVRRTARAITSRPSQSVWRYFFSHRHAGPQAAFGAYHGIELFYLFNNWENAPGATFTAADAAVQAQTLAYWVNFARTGNPNAAGQTPWPRYAPSPDCYLDITASPDGSRCGLRTDESDLWDLVRSAP